MCVGMNRYVCPAATVSAGVPHVRGDEPPYMVGTQVAKERSPCAWG